MKYVVRRARLADAEALVSFTIAEASEAEGIVKADTSVRHGIVTALHDERIATYWVLEDDGALIGNVSVVKEWSDWNAGYYWWIQSMYLTPPYRGRGLMRSLLQAVQDAARDQGALELRLYVHHENARAITAYHKAGFQDSAYCIMVLDLNAEPRLGAETRP